MGSDIVSNHHGRPHGIAAWDIPTATIRFRNEALERLIVFYARIFKALSMCFPNKTELSWFGESDIL